MVTDPAHRKVALVTGGARGIGRALALDLRRDHAVAITYHKTSPRDLPEDVLCIKADLVQPEAYQDIIAQVVAQFGRIDVLVNNAGAVAPSGLDDFNPENSATMFGVNVMAPHGLLVTALKYLRPGSAVITSRP